LPLVGDLPCFTDTSSAEIYTLSLHAALPIFRVFSGQADRSLAHVLDGPVIRGIGQPGLVKEVLVVKQPVGGNAQVRDGVEAALRSEEHTSELQSRENLVCRLLLEKKKNS